MTLRIGLLLAPVAVLALTGCAASAAPSSPSATASPTASASTSPAASASTTTSASASYRLSEVAKHNTQMDCWAAIDGSVYDLTSWISRHPGGPDKILKLCGTDATAAFHGQHDSQQKPNTQLASFRIGALVD